MRGDLSLSPAARRYDEALRYARDYRLPPGYQLPRSPHHWPAENIALLEEYWVWLEGGGASLPVIKLLYIPMAGHVLGLKLKPHQELDLNADLQKAMDFIRAKCMSAEWTDMCRNALARFGHFLRQKRGELTVDLRPFSKEPYCAGLPAWLVEQLERYQHLMQRNWRPARLNMSLQRFWRLHTHMWRWLLTRCPSANLAELKRQQVMDYIDYRLSAGLSVTTINAELRYFHCFLLFLQDQDYQVPQALLRVRCLKQPDRLPRFLTDEQVRLLRDDFEERVVQARFAREIRDSLLDRAVFYLLWQAGLRLGEVEELKLEDLDPAGRRLTVRRGKGAKDRTVYLTDTTVNALRAYLAARGVGSTSHVFLYRNEPMHKDLVHARLKYAGERVGVKVSPHQLRHTCATQLLNAGCRVTTIQKLLGHRRLNSTMVYARVYDRTVAEDYYTAMETVEQRMEAVCEGGISDTYEDSLLQLGQLVECLAEPLLTLEARLDLVMRMKLALNWASPKPLGSLVAHGPPPPCDRY